MIIFMTSQPPLGGSRRARTEAALLSAAGELLLERGYKATRVEDVAKLAGRAPATAYVHFPTKNYLVARVVAPVFDPVFTAAKAALRAPGPVTQEVIAHIGRVAEVGRENPVLTAALLEAIQDATIRSGSPSSPQDPRVILPLPVPLGDLLLKGQELGEFPADMPAEEVAAYVTSSLMLRLLTRPQESAADTAHLALSLLLPSLKDPEAWKRSR
jgi:AcrR family transcriptional regulator